MFLILNWRHNMLLRFFRWIAWRLGFVIIAYAEVKAATNELKQLAQFVHKSGALSHPRRIKARARILKHTAIAFDRIMRAVV